MRATAPHLAPAQQSRLRAKKLQKASTATGALSGTFCPRPWHEGWQQFYACSVLAVAPLLSLHDLIGCVALGLMFEAALRLKQEAKA